MLSTEFVKKCRKNFNKDLFQVVSRNAITTSGATLSAIDSEELNKLNHIFLNSIKKKNLKATEQGASGRCWIFAGLNMYRHHLIKALNLENFEYSETYIFFWDKFERANSCLQWFIDNTTKSPGDRDFDYMLKGYMDDGGYWNFFSNIVSKYGMIPKSCMKETFHSDFTDEMNVILENIIQYHAWLIWSRSTTASPAHTKKKALELVWATLVKFLGEPPQKFDWFYSDDDEESRCIGKITPIAFAKLALSTDDYIVIGNSPPPSSRPGVAVNRHYEIKMTRNVIDGKPARILNLPQRDFTRLVLKSVSAGMPVWFAADVNHDFNPYHSTLDSKIVDKSKLLPSHIHKLDKGDRILMKNIQSNHAMTFTGVNVDEHGHPVNWQVENSWGYWDNETPGQDGWLTMSHQWFCDYVLQAVIHVRLLDRATRRLIDRLEITTVEPWEADAPAWKVSGTTHSKFYKKKKPFSK